MIHFKAKFNENNFDKNKKKNYIINLQIELNSDPIG